MQRFTCSLTMILEKTLTDLLLFTGAINTNWGKLEKEKRKKEKDDFIIPDKRSKYGCLQ